MRVPARVRIGGLIILVLTSTTACKPQANTGSLPETTTSAPPPDEPQTLVAPVGEVPYMGSAKSKSLYSDEFSGEWPVEASYVTLICEGFPAGRKALTVTVDGTGYALTNAALANADGGGVEALAALAREGVDSDQMIALFTEEATAICAS